MKQLFFILSFILLSSCSSYVNSLHRQMDRAEGIRRPSNADGVDRSFDVYRKKPASTQAYNSNRTYHNRPNTYPSQMINSNRDSSVAPPVRREYRPENEVKRRYQASDLVDNSSNASLWTNNSNGSLFADDEKKTTGDILLINVQDRLKNEISMTLKKSFPQEQNRAKASKENPAQANAANNQQQDEAKEGASYHDKISGVVIEEISKNHLLIRGRKSLLFHNRKRLVEVQAMVARRDVKFDDSVDSNNILETSIQVLR